MRWIHPEYGFMSPGDFVPLFEQNGFITYVDYYVWKRTCGNLRRWIDGGLTVVPISVNSSRRDFHHEDYLQRLREPLEENGLSPELLHIEVTESLLADQPEHIRSMLEACRKAGFSVEMDDFGAGYSSLTLLGSLPLDVVKLDMSFIRQAENEKNARVLAAALKLAHSLGLRTVAEGVETEKQLSMLRSLGCYAVQGYYFSKPLPEDEFEDYLRRCADEELPAASNAIGTPSGCYMIDSEYNVLSYNSVVGNLYPSLKVGEKCHKCLMNLDHPCDICPVANGVQGPVTYLDPIRKVYESVDAVEVPLTDGTMGHALVLADMDR